MILTIPMCTTLCKRIVISLASRHETGHDEKIEYSVLVIASRVDLWWIPQLDLGRCRTYSKVAREPQNPSDRNRSQLRHLSPVAIDVCCFSLSLLRSTTFPVNKGPPLLSKFTGLSSDGLRAARSEPAVFVASRTQCAHLGRACEMQRRRSLPATTRASNQHLHFLLYGTEMSVCTDMQVIPWHLKCGG